MSFESLLSQGIFTVPKCVDCSKVVWPPADICNHCFGVVKPERGDFVGKIIEFSSQNGRYFCIVEFENTVRVIAGMTQIPKVGQCVKISKCGISDGSYIFEVICQI